MDDFTFTRAVNHGLGRAILWLRDHPWRTYEAAITHVCLHSTAYDIICEDSRVEYIYEIIGLTGASEHFANVIARGLLVSKKFSDTDQLYGLARLMARDGHKGCREAMYAKFRLDDAREHFIGDDEFIRLDGVAGLLFVLDRMGQWLETDPDYWENEQLVLEGANEIIGHDILPTVKDAARTNPNIARYLSGVAAHERKLAEPGKPDSARRAYAELRREILEDPSEISQYGLRRWGRAASEAELQEAAADARREDDPELLLAFLRIFAQREFPDPFDRLLELSASPHKDLAAAARRPLALIRHETVRNLAVKLFAEGKADDDVVDLLIKNYAPGDEALMRSLLIALTDEDDLHETCKSIVKVCEANAEAQVAPLLLEVYERCRCSLCRGRAIHVLIDRQVMPDWLMEECRYDCDMDVRKAVLKASEAAGATATARVLDASTPVE